MSNQNHGLAVQLALPKPTEHVSKTERTYSYLNYLTLHRRLIMHTETPEGMSNEFEVYTRDILVDEQALLNFRVKPTQDTKDELEHELALNNHYALLNGYSHVVGMKWPVTARIWWHFYEMLPPLGYFLKSEGFRVSEPCASDKNGKTIWSAYYLENGQYWHEWVVMPNKQEIVAPPSPPKLTDGMLVELNCGDEYYVCGEFLCNHTYPDSIRLNLFDTSLKFTAGCVPENSRDAKRVTYQGLLVWEAVK